jgi:hypothetical protein
MADMMSHVLHGITSRYRPEVLVEYLVLHLKAHQNEYAEAIVNYNTEVELKFTEAEKVIKTALANHDDQSLFKFYQDLTALKQRKPVDRSNLYRNYIELFQLSSDHDIELTLDQANYIINDTWDWAISAKNINLTYSTFNMAGAHR